ncbi:hypothetical protein FHS31_001379 [Sphingomonas vulcanisoli]|uniref:SSD domain-containing protein n=1 Tax=Sphingomonas vulcanisoli TaxID=1658060 RepID=A0ABX0TSQ0_9SPHN|nr:MMPL family transporter [Sphingomonas vulcanisoli]NIJ07769.1 hypothetical protein [Sphingomonas vulcanisoli]
MIPTRILASLVGFACRRPGLVLFGALLLAAGAMLYVSRNIQMSSDASALISQKVPWRAAEHRMDQAFPAGGDTTLVVIDGQTPELAEAAAASLTGRLAQDKRHFRSVTRPDGGAFFAREGLLFASPAEVQETTARMIAAQPILGPLASDPSLRGVAGALDTMLLGVTSGQATLDRLEPAMGKLADSLEAQAAGRPGFFSWQALIQSGKGTLAAPTRRLVMIRPVLNYGDLTPGVAASDAIRAAAQTLHLDAEHGVTVRLTGTVPLSDEEFASLADHWWVVAGAMVAAMLGTLWLATRSLRVTATILLSTVMGLIVTTALGLAAVGRLNLISVAFIPLFVGLGVDFGIQLAVRFQAERHGGADRATAITEAAVRLGPALLLAAGAVCLGFLAFLPTDYQGIAELGVIASMGMIVALLFSVTALPALLMLLRPGNPRAEVENPALAPVDAFLIHRRRLVLGGFVVALVISIALLPFVRFDFDPLHLRARDGEAVSTIYDLMKDPDRSPNTVDILTSDVAAAKALAARLDMLPEVGRTLTVASFVPEDQAPKLQTIADANTILDLTLNPIETLPPPSDADIATALAKTAASLRAAPGSGQPATDARRLAAQFDRLAKASPADRARATAMLVPPLQTMLGQLRDSLSAQPVTLADLPLEVRADWIGLHGEGHVQVVPKAAYADGDGLKRFTRAVLAVAPGATGPAISMQGAARTIAGAFVEAGVLALVIVTLLLYLALRDIREVVLTLAPVVLSGFLTLGTCVLIGQPINFANIIAFPLLFGIGVAFHIYFVMAWRSGATNLLQSSLARAIFFSAMATGTAFGSLWLSHHPGTASMGKVLMLSLVWTLICALIFEPALLGPPGKAKA